MVVVADTSPINYLVLIANIDVLPALYKRIIIPPGVLEELRHPLAPKSVREWVANAPAWLDVINPKVTLVLPKLDKGETEAISLATEFRADALLIDEYAGRQEALRRGLKVAGTLAVLDEADHAGLLEFDDAVAALRRTSFHVSQAVLDAIRQKRSG